jgi:hypothetical protein
MSNIAQKEKKIQRDLNAIFRKDKEISKRVSRSKDY